MSRNNTFDSEQLTDAAYYILLSLLVPRHGYGIMSYIEKLTEGEVVIGPATAYTLIKKLQENQYIVLADKEDNDRRKTYSITAIGKRMVDKEMERRRTMADHGHQALQSAKEEGYHG